MAVAARSTTTRVRIRAALRRSGAGCWICGEPIDYTLTTLPDTHGPRCRKPDCAGCAPHPDRFEADHVVPLKRGGADTLQNARAAHRKCNGRKAAREVAPVVRRSGALDRPGPQGE